MQHQHMRERVEAAIRCLADGGIILIQDDDGRENEGDLVGAASRATPEMINFMVTHGRGLVCQPITGEIAERLDLPPQALRNTESHATAFTVSVDAATGITTGISAGDRAVTVRVIADGTSRPEDLRRPGHVFPLVAKKGGVFERRGHTEASLDVVRLAGLPPSALICEVLSEDGTMARGEELAERAVAWGIPLISVEDVIAYRREIGDYEISDSGIARLPTAFGEFTVTAFATNDPEAREALLIESPGPMSDRAAGSSSAASSPAAGRVADRVPLVRVHSECLTGEALHSARCDCGPQLDTAMKQIADEGGAVVYLRQEGRGIGLFEKIRAYTLQDDGLDTVEANVALGHAPDHRSYGVAAAVLRRRGYDRIRLMTNNPEKVDALRRSGIVVEERVPIHAGRTQWNVHYMNTKFSRMGHINTEQPGVSARQADDAKEYAG